MSPTAAHEGEVPGMGFSMSLRISSGRRPVLKAARAASTPGGTSSESVQDVLMAAAANEPVHVPTKQLLSALGKGLDPSP